MSSPISLSINLEWGEQPTDGSRCSLCQELIIGNMFQCVMFVDFNPVYTDKKVCAVCYQPKENDPGGKT